MDTRNESCANNHSKLVVLIEAFSFITHHHNAAHRSLILDYTICQAATVASVEQTWHLTKEFLS